MKHCGRVMPASFGVAGVVLAAGLSGVGAVPVGMTVATTPVSSVVPAPSAVSGGPQACIIGLNCGCIRYRTCPGHRRPPARVPEPQMDGEVPARTGEHGVAPAAVTRIPVWASLSA